MKQRENLLDQLRHMDWADGQVWRAVLSFDAARDDDDVRSRLQHIHLVQRAFLSIWRGEPVDGKAGEGLDSVALAAWARPLCGELQGFVQAVESARLEAVVTLPWSAQMSQRLGFEPAPTTLAETIQQVVSHTTHHRGQVMARLRALGGEPPLVDYIAWLWRGRPEAEWP